METKPQQPCGEFTATNSINHDETTKLPKFKSLQHFPSIRNLCAEF